MSGNQITSCDVGIQADSSQAIVRGNTVTNSRVGITGFAVLGGSDWSVGNPNLVSNNQTGIIPRGSNEVRFNRISLNDVGIASTNGSIIHHHVIFRNNSQGILVSNVNWTSISINTISSSDFRFDVWNGITAGSFVASTAVPTISKFPLGGMNGSNRLKIEFADEAIRNTWLRVTILANANTRLLKSDVFYFGNTVANVSDVGSILRVNASDFYSVRSAISNRLVGIGVKEDLDKDGRVTVADLALVRRSMSNAALVRYFSAPIAPASLTSIPRSMDSGRLTSQVVDQVFADKFGQW